MKSPFFFSVIFTLFISCKWNVKTEPTFEHDIMNDPKLLTSNVFEPEEEDSNKKINVAWHQRYDAEQLLEHAIVHILSHRRQIERFLIKLK